MRKKRSSVMDVKNPFRVARRMDASCVVTFCMRFGFSYHCFQCKFDACTKCVVALVTQEAVELALKEKTSVKLEHEGHPQHTLTLQLRPAAFNCDACNVKEEDLSFVHIKCALNAEQPSVPSDAIGTPLVEDRENNFMHFPMADAFIDPLKRLNFGNMDQDEYSLILNTTGLKYTKYGCLFGLVYPSHCDLFTDLASPKSSLYILLSTRNFPLFCLQIHDLRRQSDVDSLLELWNLLIFCVILIWIGRLLL
ncbi:hypothetical protein L6452_31738 [Arctium lappa]|uniref:Uncharacterized protein n=1 Tax=Arctium lappa TaxID=4217 RepID=A0ACB8Z3S9_ARCLA|nr:hypothetical protein L6452_31738 [Arctium lappa]